MVVEIRAPLLMVSDCEWLAIIYWTAVTVFRSQTKSTTRLFHIKCCKFSSQLLTRKLEMTLLSWSDIRESELWEAHIEALCKKIMTVLTCGAGAIAPKIYTYSLDWPSLPFTLILQVWPDIQGRRGGGDINRTSGSMWCETLPFHTFGKGWVTELQWGVWLQETKKQWWGKWGVEGREDRERKRVSGSREGGRKERERVEVEGEGEGEGERRRGERSSWGERRHQSDVSEQHWKHRWAHTAASTPWAEVWETEVWMQKLSLSNPNPAISRFHLMSFGKNENSPWSPRNQFVQNWAKCKSSDNLFLAVWQAWPHFCATNVEIYISFHGFLEN